MQIEKLMLREKEEHNIEQHESTLNQRARLLRQGGGGGDGGGGRRGQGTGGPSAAGPIKKPFGSPDDIMKNGVRKGDTTCKYVRQNQICPNAGQGCPFSHKKPKPAAPAQTGADAAPARTKGGDRGRPEKKGRGKGDRGGRGAGSRSQTPAGGRPKNKTRTRSQSDRSRERQSKMVCYPFSRAAHNCRGAKDGCYKQHRALSDAEKLKRDRYEEAQLKAGKSLGYERTTKQANAAAANVQATPNRERSTSSERRKAKGKGKEQKKGGGKGKDTFCRTFKETGKCDRGKNCWFFSTTPNHP